MPRRLSAILQLIRLKQWVKNGFIFAPLLFTPSAVNAHTISVTLLALLSFCLTASGVYVLNDLMDMETDRLHPEKRHRPLASGAVPLGQAWVLSPVLIGLGAGLAYHITVEFFWIIVIYSAMNFIYSTAAKHYAIVDVMVISVGFVMRVMAGAVVIDILPSPWLFECAGLIALFMAIAKRRDDLLLKEQLGHDQRGSLKKYNIQFLDMVMVMVLGCTLTLYMIYTATEEVQARLGTHHLFYTVPWVMAGILRYLQLTIVENKSGSPTDLVLSDKMLLGCGAGWLLTLLSLIYLRV